MRVLHPSGGLCNEAGARPPHQAQTEEGGRGATTAGVRKLVAKDRFMEGVRAGVGAAQQLLDRLEVGVVLRLEEDMVLEATREDDGEVGERKAGRVGPGVEDAVDGCKPSEAEGRPVQPEDGTDDRMTEAAAAGEDWEDEVEWGEFAGASDGGLSEAETVEAADVRDVGEMGKEIMAATDLLEEMVMVGPPPALSAAGKKKAARKVRKRATVQLQRAVRSWLLRARVARWESITACE
jgi:hypothetical protein